MTLPEFRFAALFTAAAFAFSSISDNSYAQVILDTEFSAAEGFVDALLQFQGANTTTGGAFLGQDLATVDTSGTGTLIGPSESATGTFPFSRNLFNQGVTGGEAGNMGALSTGSFTAGDQIRIATVYQFDLVEDLDPASVAGTFNTELADIGIRDSFGTRQGAVINTNGADLFDAAPQQGFDAMFNIFGTGIGDEVNVGGILQAFPSFTSDRDGPSGLIIPGRDIGVNPNGLAVEADGVTPVDPTSTPDLESDPLQFDYLIETDGAGTFSILEFSVTNIATEQVFDFDVANAIANSPTFTGSFDFLAEVDIEVPDGGPSVAIGDPSPDAFLGFTPAPNAVPGFELNIDSLLFEFIPINGVSQPGDFDGDGDVDVLDYVALRDQAGQPSEADFAAFVDNFGAGVPALAAASAPVPEPASIFMIGLAGIALAARRKS